MKRILSLVLVLAMIFSLAACSGAGTTMTMGTGGTAGTYYGYGGILGTQIKNVAGITVNVVSTDGSKANILGIDAGNYQLASNYSSLGPDPANYYDNYLNSSLFSFYRSDVLDQAWIDGMTGATDEERQAAYSIVQHELTDAAVWLIQPRNWGYYAGNETCGLDEAMFTSTGMFVYFHKLYKIAE